MTEALRVFANLRMACAFAMETCFLHDALFGGNSAQGGCCSEGSAVEVGATARGVHLATMYRGRPIDEERYRPFVVTMLVGCVLWVCSGGSVHAYLICPDWTQLGPDGVEQLAGFRPLVALTSMGLLFGLIVEVAKFSGAVLRSEFATVFGPIAAGAAVGALQGAVVPTAAWGFAASVVYRSEETRILSGALVGLMLAVPAIMIGISIRQRGRPW